MKKIFLVALVFLSIGAQSQVENLIPQYIFRNSLRVGGAGNNEPGTYLQIGPNSGGNKGLGLPRVANTSVVVSPTKGVTVYDLSKDSTAYYNGTTWVYSGSGGGTTIINQGAVLDTFQYSNNADVIMGDTTTVLVLGDGGDNTANRNITLKSAATFAGKTLKILNYNGGDYFNVLTSGIIGIDGIVFSVLKQPAAYTLISGGGTWRVQSISEIIEPGSGGPSGGNSSGAIVTWD